MRLETIDAYRMVKGVEALGHLITVGWNDKIVLLLDPIVRQVLPVDAFLFTKFIVVEPQADFNHVVFDHLALRSRANTTREIMDIPLNLRARGQGTTDITRHFLAPFTHGVFGEHAISTKLTVFIFDKNDGICVVDDRRCISARLHLNCLNAAICNCRRYSGVNNLLYPHIIAICRDIIGG